MKPLPYIRMTFRTVSPPDVVRAQIAQMIASGRFWLKRPPEPFHGTIDGLHFKMMRVLGMWVRNSFQPVVVGDVVQGQFGAEVRVRMRLHMGVAIGVTFWFGVLFVSVGKSVYTAMMLGRPVDNVLAIVAAFALFAYGLMSVSFWPEVKKARVLLRDALGIADADVLEG